MRHGVLDVDRDGLLHEHHGVPRGDSRGPRHSWQAACGGDDGPLAKPVTRRMHLRPDVDQPVGGRERPRGARIEPSEPHGILVRIGPGDARPQ